MEKNFTSCKLSFLVCILGMLCSQYNTLKDIFASYVVPEGNAFLLLHPVSIEVQLKFK